MKKLVRESLIKQPKDNPRVKLANGKIITLPDDKTDRYSVQYYLQGMGIPEKLASTFKLIN